MMDFTVISVGKSRLKEPCFAAAADEYVKRIQKIKLIDVKDDGEILAKIPKNVYVFALCVEGERLTSEGLSEKLNKIYLSEKKGIYFIIGGSDGLSERVKSAADMKLSMSDMTFAHRLAKIMLLEQIYRALSIQNNAKYHK
jgi:23S rRNA (pseudouridine1915-N3)-methyltransferase